MCLFIAHCLSCGRAVEIQTLLPHKDVGAGAKDPRLRGTREAETRIHMMQNRLSRVLFSWTGFFSHTGRSLPCFLSLEGILDRRDICPQLTRDHSRSLAGEEKSSTQRLSAVVGRITRN